MSDWDSIDAAVKRTLKRTGEPLTIDLADSTLCTHGRITSLDVDIEGDEGVIVQGVLQLQLAWSDASMIDIDIEAGKVVTVNRDDESTAHLVSSCRKLNDANGRVGLQAAG